MIEINWSDVWQTLDSLKNYFIALGITAASCIIVMIACAKRPKQEKFLVRAHGGMLILVSLILVVNIICTGPMYTLLSLVTGNGSLSQETSDAAVLRAEEIADEGIVLLQNDQNLLPLGGGNVNVFGWASTNPIYGGTGSGSMNDAYPTISLLEGLANAGFTTNDQLSDFYTAYRADRPEVGMWAQEWTLPEPPASSYTDAMISGAKDFSDTALIVFSRPGGEHIDLPQDMTGLNYTQNSDSYEDFPAGRHYLELSRSERDLVNLVCANFDNVVIICNSSNAMQLDFVDDYSQIKSVIWCPAAGQNGFNSLGRILSGAVNPSGKAADTFIRDFTLAPWWNNFGYNVYDNMGEFAAPEDDAFVPGTLPHFVDYVEGIYVGYRYWETAAAERFINYDEAVQYPFGHGLSYTNFEQASAAPSTSLREEDKARFVNNSNYQIPTDLNAEMPVTGAKNGMMVTELRGAPYDNPRWETLLDNLTIADMNNMISLGSYQTPAVDSIGKVQTVDCDGPAALNNNFTQVGSVGFPAAVMIASTWNEDLARSFGDGIADMAEEMNVSGWYAPAMNIHRTPFGGRNFEYYSEDGLLSGRIASSAADAASVRGVYPYLKHFALNEQETGRWEMLTTWSTEQAIREIYLRPFELCVKDNVASGGGAAGHPMAIMSSYNYIGSQWAGACGSLLNTVLRDEWGFRGSVLTDYFANFGYMDATRSIHNGGSACLMNRDMVTNNVTDTDNPLTVQQMRRACKDVLYTGVNSRGHAPENMTSGLMSWQIILIVADVILAAAVIALEVVIFKNYEKKVNVGTVEK